MEAAFGRLRNGGRAAFGRPPNVVETMMGIDIIDVSHEYCYNFDVFKMFHESRDDKEAEDTIRLL